MTFTSSRRRSPAPIMFRQGWSRDLHAGPKGIALARERGCLLAWDEAGWLTLLDLNGESQAQRLFPGLGTATVADDGSTLAAAGKDGEVWWLTPDLTPRFTRSLPHPPLALALDPFGQYLAAADTAGNVHILNRAGQSVGKFESPRPLHHLAFVPAMPVLVGCADFGLVVGINIEGQPLWRDGLVATIGALSSDGSGNKILLACFSEGLHQYRSDGHKCKRIVSPEPCRLVSQSFDGRRVVVSSLTQKLLAFGEKDQIVGRHEADKPIQALALGALGDVLFVALTRGPIVRYDLSDQPLVRVPT